MFMFEKPKSSLATYIMLYAASFRRLVLKHQASRKALALSPRPGSARPSSALSNGRPTTANNFRSHRPTTPYKSRDGDRIKAIQTMFLLTEEEVYEMYRAFLFMARKRDVLPPLRQRKSKERKSKSRQQKKKESSKQDESSQPNQTKSRWRHKKEEDEKEQSSPSGMTIDLDSTNPNRPWEDKTKPKVTLSLLDFFATFNLPNGGFYDAIFELVGIKDFHSMTFSEFLDGVITYSFFTVSDMIQFVFFILDKNKDGKIPRLQLLRLLDSLHCKNSLMFQHAVCPASEESSSIDYETTTRLFADFPLMLEPAFRLQTTLRRRLMGEKFWRKKQIQISSVEKVRERRRRGEERRLYREREGKIRAELGWVSFYTDRKSRAKITREFPEPVVSLDDSGEIVVGWKYVLNLDEDEDDKTDE